MLTVFGLSGPDDAPGNDWFIDRFTPEWRRVSKCPTDWAIGMMNYGDLLVMTHDSLVSEWDIVRHRYDSRNKPLEHWARDIIHEGALYLSEE
jgi:hypothetical protein